MKKSNRLLGDAYANALELARMHKQVCFPIISGGSHRGSFKLRSIIELSLKSILAWTEQELVVEKKGYKLTDIVWVALDYEVATLIAKACNTQMDGTIKAVVI